MNVDELVAYTTQKPRHAPRRFFAHSNHLYSPSAVTNSAGQVVTRFAYDAYGKQSILNAAGSAVITNDPAVLGRGFTGYQIDAETALDYARERMYSPAQGRFISRDPWQSRDEGPSPFDGYQSGFNMFSAYFIPNTTDPSGTIDFDPSQIPNGRENMKRAIEKYGQEWAKKAYQWCRKHDMAKAMDVQWAQKHTELRNKAKRVSGSVNSKLLGIVAVGACELLCYVQLKSCLNQAQSDFDEELGTAGSLIDQNQFQMAEERINNAETIALADIATCGTKYLICALGCLCPLSLF